VRFVGIEAGRLRHRVTFERRIDQQDSVTGGVTTVWSALFTDVPAAIEPLTARELIAAQAVQSKITARITVRYRNGLVATQRIKHGTRIYNPEGIIPDRDSGLDFVTIPCSLGTNDG
jgi:SPP1 family predicted phage head-tail adaptor